MKIFIAILMLVTFNAFGQTCEEKVREAVVAELATQELVFDNRMDDSVTYMGDGFFEVEASVVPSDSPEQWPWHMTWEVIIDASCKVTDITLVDSYI